MEPNKSSVKHPSGLIRALKVDLRRSLWAPSFLITILLLLAWMLLGNFRMLFPFSIDYLNYHGLGRMLNRATTSFLDQAYLLLPIATVAFSGSYLTDQKSGFLDSIIERVGIQAYGRSRILTAALAPFLASAVAILIYTAVALAGGISAIGNIPPDQYGFYGYPYSSLLGADGSHFLTYLLVRIVITGLTAGLSSVFALAVSAFVRNYYVTMLAPLIAYFLLLTLGDIIPFFLDPYNIPFSQTFQDAWLSFIWAVVYLLTMTALCGCLFLWKLRKECTE